MTLRRLLVAWVVVVAATMGQGSACLQIVGGRIVLASDAPDPNVFVWDSRVRLIDYAGGNWANTRSVIDHTTLAVPGTRAIVVDCHPKATRPKYSADDEDLIGIKITHGPYRNRWGWVLSSDTREMREDPTPVPPLSPR